MISINTNYSSLILNKSLQKSTDVMSLAMERMSTGWRINSAKDDAAGLAVSSNLEVQSRSLAQANKNTQDGVSLLQTATSTLTMMTNQLNKLRDLAMQASNDTYGTLSRIAMQKEADAIAKELLRVKESTDFNGKKIFEVLTPETYAKKTEQTPSPSVGYHKVESKTVEELDAQYGAGNYIAVTTAEELNNALKGSNKVVLMADIDLNDLGRSETGNWSTRDFNGTFDGNGYEIDNLYINRPDVNEQGFIGQASGATIKNVMLNNANIEAASRSGGLVSILKNSTIDNCSISGNINCKEWIAGGLIGLCAISGPSSITNCSFSGEIKGGNDLGCIIGLCEDTSCEIRNCSASGNIINTSASRIGGLVGRTYAPIINSYSTVNISGNIHSGGLVGWNYSTISNSYSTGKITGSGGGLVGYNLSGTATNSYWDTETSGKTTSAGGTGKTTAEMQNIQTYLDSDWDISEYSEDTPPTTTWFIKSGENYPQLASEWRSPQKIRLQVGTDSESYSAITLETGLNIDDFSVNLSTSSSASKSLDKIDKMIDALVAQNGKLGAGLNRLTSVLEAQEVTRINTIAAHSQIKDADIAETSSTFIKSQILQNASATLISQSANLIPQMALNLIQNASIKK